MYLGLLQQNVLSDLHQSWLTTGQLVNGFIILQHQTLKTSVETLRHTSGRGIQLTHCVVLSTIILDSGVFQTLTLTIPSFQIYTRSNIMFANKLISFKHSALRKGA